MRLAGISWAKRCWSRWWLVWITAVAGSLVGEQPLAHGQALLHSTQRTCRSGEQGSRRPRVAARPQSTLHGSPVGRPCDRNPKLCVLRPPCGHVRQPAEPCRLTNVLVRRPIAVAQMPTPLDASRSGMRPNAPREEHQSAFALVRGLWWAWLGLNQRPHPYQWSWAWRPTPAHENGSTVEPQGRPLLRGGGERRVDRISDLRVCAARRRFST
jgi:hypothetical protein